MPVSGDSQTVSRLESGMFRRFSRWAARLPSSFILFVYVLAIPVFGYGYYQFLPNDFYHATAKYEASLGIEASGLVRALTDDFQQQLRHLYGGNTVRVDDLTFNVEHAQFTAVKGTSDEWSVAAVAWIKGRQGASAGEDQFFVPLTLPFTWAPVSANFADGFDHEIVIDSLSTDGRSLLPLFKCQQSVGWNGCLRVSQATHRAIVGFRDALRGFPERTRGHFLRMVYFSAVTISTLGYGDIVPLTWRSRLAVTFEAFLGPLLAGLFLNSLVAEANRDSKSRAARVDDAN